MLQIFSGSILVVLIMLVFTNTILLKTFKSKVLWIILSCTLPLALFGMYYRYKAQIIIEETRKLGDLRLAIFQFYMIIGCAGLIFTLQLIKLMHLLSLRKEQKTLGKLD